MSAEILNGRAIAKTLRAEVAVAASAFANAHGRKPGLHVILVGDDPASQVYVRNKEKAAAKAGLDGHLHRLDASVSEEVLLAKLHELNDDDAVDGILVQLPLPKHLDSSVIIDAIDPAKDVDGLHPLNAGLLAIGRPGLRPCTPRGCMHLLEAAGVDLSGKRALVIGRSELVGKPILQMLVAKNATVTLAHSRTLDLPARVAEADVVVAAVGKAKMVRGEWLKEGAVVIDVGINRLEDGSLCGDVDFESACERASFITPVPRGVGPMTIAMLLDNTVVAANARIAGA